MVKASGLAAGKGVFVAQSREEACQAARDMLNVRALVFKIAAFLKLIVRNIFFFVLQDASFIMTYMYQYSQYCSDNNSHRSNIVVKLSNYLYYSVE